MNADDRQRKCLELADLLIDLAQDTYPVEAVELSVPLLLRDLEEEGLLSDVQAQSLDHLCRGWDPFDEEGTGAEQCAERHLALGFCNLESEFSETEIDRLIHLARTRMNR